MSTIEHKVDQILKKSDALEKKVDSFNTRRLKLNNKSAALEFEPKLKAKAETFDIPNEKMSAFEKFMLDNKKL